ncbi:MAG TPA: hypothetical protein PLE26_01415 [Candidatus Paceibacterota bacterium]|nr:hypothetical protein [Candidatus Paceibacterota bacterium]HQB57118.1 hypothetical protein [Candidatus Paceibacterota bacterium]
MAKSFAQTPSLINKSCNSTILTSSQTCTAEAVAGFADQIVIGVHDTEPSRMREHESAPFSSKKPLILL